MFNSTANEDVNLNAHACAVMVGIVVWSSADNILFSSMVR